MCVVAPPWIRVWGDKDLIMRHLLLMSLCSAFCAAPSLAQSLQPQFYMWSPAPSGWDKHQMIPILVANEGLESSDPVDVAADLAAKIQDYFDAGHPMDKIAILIFNFGMRNSSAVSLIDEDDAIVPAPIWNVPNEPAYEEMPYQQPWMTNGRAKVKAWMEDFLDAYSAETYNNGTGFVSLPIPARFHFDSEMSLSTCCDVDYTRILRALPNEYPINRWSTVAVPGFGTATMADLYADAIDMYDWPDEALTHSSALDPNVGPSDDANKHYFIWYWNICARALDAAMNEVAYEVINSHFPNDTPLVSNYEDINADGEPAIFGWHSAPDYTQATWPYGVVPQRAWFNGTTVGGGAGAQYLRVHVETSPNWLNWSTFPGTTAADFSSPALYTYVFGDPEVPPGEIESNQTYSHRGYNYYLPSWSTGDESSWEALWDCSLRNQRHNVESILNSGSTPAQITPWIAHIGTNPSAKGKEPHYITAEDTRRQLAMLRAKNIGEILVWAHPEHSNAAWADYFKVVQQVYTPMLQWYSILEGSGLQTPDAAALQFTLEDAGNDTLIIQSSSSSIAGIIVQFDGLWPGASGPKLGNHIRLNLELAAFMDNMSAADRDDLRVVAYIYKPSITDWVALPCNDYSNNRMGFFAPIETLAQEIDRCDLRRTLTIDHCVVEDDDVFVKVVVYSSDSSFTVAFDLVQLYWADDGTIGCGSTENLQGADMNYSGTVSTSDLTKFTSDYMNSKPAADFNNDGVINASDMAAFLAKYAQ